LVATDIKYGLLRMAPRDWHDFQCFTAHLFQQLGCTAQVDWEVAGARATHAVDVWVSSQAHGLTINWVVECKRLKRPVTKAHVLTLKAIVEDVGADKGIIVSDSGFQAGAMAAARRTNVVLMSSTDLKAYAAQQLAGGRPKRRVPDRALAFQLDLIPVTAPVSAYEALLLRSHDQGIQSLVVKRLIRVGSAEAVLLLTQRLMDSWGMRAIRKTQLGLAELADAGGLLALTALILSDARFYEERLEIVAATLGRLGDKQGECAVRSLFPKRHYYSGLNFSHAQAREIPKDIETLRGLPNRDVAIGIELASFICDAALADTIRPAMTMSEVLQFVTCRLPGLTRVVRSRPLPSELDHRPVS
jgi:hypothetical protein